jgi:hypothetical protein
VPLYGDGLQERDWLHVERPLPRRRPALIERGKREAEGLQHGGGNQCRRYVGPNATDSVELVGKPTSRDHAGCRSPGTIAAIR